MGIVEGLDVLLDAVAYANQTLFPWPVPYVVHGLALVVALAVFFNRGRRRWLGRLVKIWLAISFSFVSLVMRSVLAYLEANASQVNSTLFLMGSIAYGLIGLAFLVDVWLDKLEFAAASEQPSRLAWVGLLGALSITVFYPLTQLLGGQRYPRMVVYGEEIPVLAYAVYLLIMNVPNTSRLALGLLSTMALLSGASGSLGLGYWSDLYGAFAGLLGLAVLGVWLRDVRKPGNEEPSADETSRVRKVPKVVWRLLRLPPRILYALGLGSLQGRLVLLLTTVGRKSGLPRVTPLQYEEVNGTFQVGAARGVKADWFRNIQANPAVEVRVKSRRFRGQAEPVVDPARIADFLELRLRRHPRMIGAMFRSEGLPPMPDREQLEAYAARRAMVVIRPVEEG